VSAHARAGAEWLLSTGKDRAKCSPDHSGGLIRCPSLSCILMALGATRESRVVTHVLLIITYKTQASWSCRKSKHLAQLAAKQARASGQALNGFARHSCVHVQIYPTPWLHDPHAHTLCMRTPCVFTVIGDLQQKASSWWCDGASFWCQVIEERRAVLQLH